VSLNDIVEETEIEEKELEKRADEIQSRIEDRAAYCLPEDPEECP